MKSKHCIVVLGMHRSGTSAVASLLTSFGLYPGRKLIGCNEWNPLGHYESERIVRLNDRLLDACGAHWHSLFPNILPTEVLLEEFGELASQILQEDYENYSSILIKDPRLCHLMPFWRAVLEKEAILVSYVLVVRKPKSCALSLRKRDGFDLLKGFWLWGAYLISGLEKIKDQQPLIVSYEHLLENPSREVQVIKDWLLTRQVDVTLENTKWQDLIDPGLSHADVDSEDVIDRVLPPQFVDELYRILMKASGEDGYWFDQIKRHFQWQRCQDLPQLIALVESESILLRHTIDRQAEELRSASNYINELVVKLDNTHPEDFQQPNVTDQSSLEKTNEDFLVTEPHGFDNQKLISDQKVSWRQFLKIFKPKR